MGWFEDWGAPALGGIGGFLLGGPVGAGIGASMGSNYSNASQTRSANAQNSANIDKQMGFEKDMSNTAHQREVQDLQAAGLNPTLSAGGNGSSTPSGGAANAQAPEISMPDLFAYGVSMKQLEQADQRLAIDKANSAANISKTLSDTDLNKMRKILMQKGMPRAQLEGAGAEVLSNVLKYLKNSVNKPSNTRRERDFFGAEGWEKKNNENGNSWNQLRKP